jgi:hypothetical protein
MATTHDRRLLAVSLTVAQMRALCAAARLMRTTGGPELVGSLAPLERAMEALEAAWKVGRPDYGEVYRSKYGSPAEPRKGGGGLAVAWGRGR